MNTNYTDAMNEKKELDRRPTPKKEYVPGKNIQKVWNKLACQEHFQQS